MPQQNNRTAALLDWLSQGLGLEVRDIAPASNDASFRHYFRVVHAKGRHIVMDAPPEKENTAGFVKVQRLLRDVPLPVPEIIAANPEQGFLLLEDFGDRHYLQALSPDNADHLYGMALGCLFALQTGVDAAGCALPQYDAVLLERELGIFQEWFWHGLLQKPLDAHGQAVWKRTCELLLGSALAQPQVCVHRDYHSRNLMYLGDKPPGILDFQDAVVGPVTYDLVSLLKDCYVAWPEKRVDVWCDGYYRRLLLAGLIDCRRERFRRWFDWMGMQRHLKAAGIFARLHLRDGKSGYLDDIPRTMAYVLDVGGRYPEFAEFDALLRRHIRPGGYY